MKQKVLIDIKVVCDPPNDVTRWDRTLEAKAKSLEGWCRDFESFVRDHRSQDPVGMSVEREYQEQCSYCGYEWETDDDGVPVCCQKAIDEHEGVFSAMGLEEPKFPTAEVVVK